MVTLVGRAGPQPYTLPDLRRCPGRSFYTGRQDLVITEAARSGSDPTMAAAWCVTLILSCLRHFNLISNAFENLYYWRRLWPA